MSDLELTPETIDAIAARVVEMLTERNLVEAQKPAQRWLTVTQAAEVIGRSPDFIRAHAEELGAVAVGEGAKKHLNIPLARLEELERNAAPRREDPTPPPQPRRRRRTPAQPSRIKLQARPLPPKGTRP